MDIKVYCLTHLSINKKKVFILFYFFIIYFNVILIVMFEQLLRFITFKTSSTCIIFFSSLFVLLGSFSSIFVLLSEFVFPISNWSSIYLFSLLSIIVYGRASTTLVCLIFLEMMLLFKFYLLFFFTKL